MRGQAVGANSYDQVAISDAGEQILAEKSSREAVTLANLDDTDTVWLGFDDQVIAGVGGSGFPLEAGASIKLKTAEAIHGIMAAGLAAVVAFLEEA